VITSKKGGGRGKRKTYVTVKGIVECTLDEVSESLYEQEGGIPTSNEEKEGTGRR